MSLSLSPIAIVLGPWVTPPREGLARGVGSGSAHEPLYVSYLEAVFQLSGLAEEILHLRYQVQFTCYGSDLSVGFRMQRPRASRSPKERLCKTHFEMICYILSRVIYAEPLPEPLRGDLLKRPSNVFPAPL